MTLDNDLTVNHLKEGTQLREEGFRTAYPHKTNIWKLSNWKLTIKSLFEHLAEMSSK
jgi:hypothetical protein